MSDNYRTYFGRKFYQSKDGYWTHTKRPLIQAHRWVWINIKGEIPEGMVIHHIDADKSNNEIDNLMLLSRSDHTLEHCKDEKEKAIRRNRLNQIRPLMHEYLRSNEGRKKQSQSAKEGWKKRAYKIVKCFQCGSEKETKQPWTKFCSPNCLMRFRRKSKTGKVEAKCDICDKVYLIDKSSNQKFCSVSCGAKNSARNRKKSKTIL